MAGLGGVRAVLFDAVGTLIRPEPSVADAYLAVARRHGSRLSLEEITNRFDFAISAPARVARGLAELGGREVYLDRPPIDYERERHRWQAIVCAVLHDVPRAAGEPFEVLWNHFAEPCNWRLDDDAASTWLALEASGMVLGIASNFDDRLAGVCRGLPPLDRCQNIFWSARVGWPKPSPRFFAHVQDELGLRAGEILLVGDDYENDYLGATAAGWQAVFVERSEICEHPESNRIQRLSELVEWMKDEG